MIREEPNFSQIKQSILIRKNTTQNALCIIFRQRVKAESQKIFSVTEHGEQSTRINAVSALHYLRSVQNLAAERLTYYYAVVDGRKLNATITRYRKFSAEYNFRYAADETVSQGGKIFPRRNSARFLSIGMLENLHFDTFHMKKYN